MEILVTSLSLPTVPHGGYPMWKLIFWAALEELVRSAPVAIWPVWGHLVGLLWVLPHPKEVFWRNLIAAAAYAAIIWGIGPIPGGIINTILHVSYNLVLRRKGAYYDRNDKTERFVD